jgi:2-keto-4-pentenoate hydratase
MQLRGIRSSAHRRVEAMTARNSGADRIDEERSMTIALQTALERLIEVQSSHRPVAPLSETHGDFTLEHAYAVQEALRAELDRRGQRPIGWKLGATSPSGQAVMGVKGGCGGITDTSLP